MKTKKLMVKFTCDECGKESKEIEDGKESYPYSEGWIYLYRFFIKLKKDKIWREEDKHFCSKGCSNKFINKIFKKNNE